MTRTLVAALATVFLSLSFTGCTFVTVDPALAQGSDVLVQAGLRLPRSHQYELYDRVNQTYTVVRVETVPSYVQQGAWIHDRTAGVWVAHPSVGEPNPQYTAAATAPGRDVRREAPVTDRDVLVQGGLRLPRSHRYELYDRGNQSYTVVRVETVPSYVQQGAWIHDRTAGLWVSHPSVGEPSADYAVTGRAVGRGAAVSDRDFLVQAGLRLPRPHQYELYDRVNQTYTVVRVETVPSYVQQGAWIHDRTTGVWVSHPSVGEPNPQYTAAATAPAPGRDVRRGEELLGQLEVDFRADRDAIEVGRDEGRFQKIRIVVRGAPIQLSDMKVIFADDSVFDPVSRNQILRENSAYVFDLPGQRRVIKRIAFQYRSLDRREGKATVLVYGQH